MQSNKNTINMIIGREIHANQRVNDTAMISYSDREREKKFSAKLLDCLVD